MDLPEESVLRDLITRYAAFVAAAGSALESPELVLPTGEFFPDAFERDGDSVITFFKRMLTYAPVAADLPVAIRFVEPESEEQSGKSCSSGACGSGGGAEARENVTELADGYLVDVPVGDLGSATVMAGSFARSIGALVLHEAGEMAEAGSDSSSLEIGIASEIASVACGFGPLLLGASYIYGKGCGGVRVHQGTRLHVSELAVLCALFARMHDHKPAAVRAHLETTPLEAFDTALAWVDSNHEIVEGLRTRPAAIASGLFTIGGTKSLLGRWFGGRKKSEPAPVAVPQRTRTPEEAQRIAASRALVDEAFADLRK